MSPCSRSTSMARRTVLYPTPYASARSRSGGSLARGTHSPAAIRAAMCSATCSYMTRSGVGSNGGTVMVSTLKDT
jgi:hypothetical protein